MLLLADSLSHQGRGQRMGDEEEAQTEARQLCCLASGACPNTCTEELEWAAPVMALCVVLHRSYWICQKTQEKDIPFQHGEGTSQLPEGLLRHTATFPTLQSLHTGGKPFHPTHRQRADRRPCRPLATVHPSPCPERLQSPLISTQERGARQYLITAGGMPLGMPAWAGWCQRRKGTIADPDRQVDRQTNPFPLYMYPSELHMSGVPGSSALSLCLRC